MPKSEQQQLIFIGYCQKGDLRGVKALLSNTRPEEFSHNLLEGFQLYLTLILFDMPKRQGSKSAY